MKIFAFLVPVLAHGWGGEVEEVWSVADGGNAHGKARVCLQRSLKTRVDTVSGCTTAVTPLDLVFLIDSSTSITKFENGFKASQDFVKNVTAELPVGSGAHDIRVAVVQFSNSKNPEIELANGISKPAVHQAVEAMTHLRGGTYTAGAIDYATDHTFQDSRPDAAKMMILLTDGQSNDNYRSVQDAADDARSKGIEIVAIGVNSYVRQELEDIVGPDGKILNVTNYKDLVDIVGDTTQIVCDEVSTAKPTPAPTPEPTLPTPLPTPAPTLQPTPAPTPEPTPQPTTQLTSSPTPAPSPPPTPAPLTKHSNAFLKSAVDDKCLLYESIGSIKVVKVVKCQADLSCGEGNWCQQWDFEDGGTLRSAGHDACLQVPQGLQWVKKCDSEDRQIWTHDEQDRLVSDKNGKCLQRLTGLLGHVEMKKCKDNEKAQKWYFAATWNASQKASELAFNE